MIATGDGYAAGNKNECIGMGKAIGWENLNIAEGLNWIPDSSCFNAVPEGKSGERLVMIYYREL